MTKIGIIVHSFFDLEVIQECVFSQWMTGKGDWHFAAAEEWGIAMLARFWGGRGGMSGCKTKQLPEKLNGMDMLDMLDMWQHKFVSFNCFWLVACRHFEICQDQGVLAATSRSRWAGMLMNVDIWIWNWSSIPTKHYTLQVVDVAACRVVKSVGVSTQWFAFEVFLWLGYFSISQLHKDCKQHVFLSLFRRTHWVLIETCSIRGTMMHLDMPVCFLETFRSKECSPHSLQHLPGYAAKQLWADSALVATSPRHI